VALTKRSNRYINPRERINIKRRTDFMRTTKWTILAVVIGLGLLAGAGPLPAQEKYPSRAIEYVIPWPPGGSTDIASRIFANELQKVLKSPVAPVNKGGASATIGGTAVYRAKKDGYTLLGSSLGWLLGSITLEGVPYDPLKDFVHITKVSTTPHGIYVRKDSPIKTLEDLIDRAKKNPGAVSCGTAGSGSDGHYNIEIFQKAAGVQLKHVPFKGVSEVPPAVLGGHVDIGIGVVSAWLSFISSGDVRTLAITGTSRLKDLPGVPTFNERGLKQTFLNNWVGFSAPTGLPQPVMDVLAQSSEKIVKSKEFIDAVEKTGGVVEFMRSAEFQKMLEDERKIGDAIAENLGLKQAPKK
jgi:tripartite-type tricarboxylate transporter receptor subunit TctC